VTIKNTFYNRPPVPVSKVKDGFMTICRSTEDEVMFDVMMFDAQEKLGYEDSTLLSSADILHFIDTFGIADKGNANKVIKTRYSDIAKRRGCEVVAIKNLLFDLHEMGKLNLHEYKTDPDRIKLTLFKKRKYNKRGV
jgi:hypothetical protein